jgi:hypothetical protein
MGWRFIGLFLADSKLPMEITLKIGNRLGEANSMTAGPDYSIYTLQQLLNARHWFDPDRSPSRRRSVEEEIQKRCAPYQETTTRTASLGPRYRPYGFMCGVFFLMVSTGPFVAVEFLDAMNIVTDVNGDNALLSGAWSLLTLPLAVIVSIIGAMMDAERVVKWFNL